MPGWVIILMMSVSFTAVLATGQGLYWAWIAKQEREQEELLRRLGGGAGGEADEGIFREHSKDAVATALGGLGDYFEELIRAADVDYGVSNLLTRMAIGGGIGALAGGIFMFPMGIALGLPAAYLPLYLVKSRGKARIQKLVEQLPDSLDLMSRSLSAGIGLNDAFKLVAEEMPMPVAGEFGRISEEIRFGRDIREAFEKLLERNPGVFDLRIFVSSVMLQRDTGGNLIEILESISDTIRSRFLFDAKVSAMTSEARLSALILGGLPIAVGLLLTFMNPTYLEPLVTTYKGYALCFVGGSMYTVGALIINDLSKVEV